MSPADAEAIAISYFVFPAMEKERNHIHNLVDVFKNFKINYKILTSDTPIQIVIIPGNEEVRRTAQKLQQNNLDIRPILYPTVPKGQERLRIVLHAFNTIEDIKSLAEILK
jgi:8-amino-7-oxononanoate synthase